MRRFSGILVGISALFVACGGGDPEKQVVDAFFSAVKDGDPAGVERVSLIPFEAQAETWEIVERGPESDAPFQLADLEAQLRSKRNEVDAQRSDISAFIGDNRETYEAYTRQYAEDPSKPFTGEIAAFNEQLRAMQTRVGELEAEAEQLGYDVEALRNAASRSLSTPVDASFEGTVKVKPLQVKVNDGSSDKTYTVVLQRYDLVDTKQGRSLTPRWLVAEIQPQG